MIQRKFGLGNNFLRISLRVGRLALGKGLVKISIVIGMVALKFITGNQRRKSAMPRVINTMEESAT